MLKPLFKLEEGLLRVEKWILVVAVLLMLLLAAYTVFYRNVLIPWQNHLSTSGPPVVEQVEPDAAAGSPSSDDEASEDGGGEDFGGFGGGFGSTDEPEDEAADNGGDDFGGFGGGFGSADEPEDEASDEAADEGGEDFGGFGGGFGAAEDGGETTKQADAEPEPVGEQPAASVEQAPAEPIGGPPPKGSFAAQVIEIINTLKFHWLDILLRQLVIISGFLGAMLATRQRSHITVDAVGKLLEGRLEHTVQMATSLVAAIICAFLALSGWELIQIGLEYPRQLIPWAKEWHFQLAFPIGWGLLAFHFVMRTIESATLTIEHPEGDADSGEPQEEAA